MAIVTGWDEKETILRPDNTPKDVEPMLPHTPYCYGGDVDTIVLIRAHPAAENDPLGAVFFEHLFRLLDEAHRAKKAPDGIQVMVMQSVKHNAAVRHLADLSPDTPPIPHLSCCRLMNGLVAYVGGYHGYSKLAWRISGGCWAIRQRSRGSCTWIERVMIQMKGTQSAVNSV